MAAQWVWEAIIWRELQVEGGMLITSVYSRDAAASLFLLFCLFMSWLIMKQRAGDSSESRKCLNLSSSSHTPAVREAGAGLGLWGWRGTELSSHRHFLNSDKGGEGQRWGQINSISSVQFTKKMPKILCPVAPTRIKQDVPTKHKMKCTQSHS